MYWLLFPNAQGHFSVFTEIYTQFTLGVLESSEGERILMRETCHHSLVGLENET